MHTTSYSIRQRWNGPLVSDMQPGVMKTISWYTLVLRSLHESFSVLKGNLDLMGSAQKDIALIVHMHVYYFWISS